MEAEAPRRHGLLICVLTTKGHDHKTPMYFGYLPPLMFGKPLLNNPMRFDRVQSQK